MTLPDTVLVRRKDVMSYLGVSRDQFRGMVQSGLLTPRFLRKNRRGKPAGRPMYSKLEVQAVERGI
jgi:hypothetical protein